MGFEDAVFSILEFPRGQGHLASQLQHSRPARDNLGLILGSAPGSGSLRGSGAGSGSRVPVPAWEASVELLALPTAVAGEWELFHSNS